ncbi:hypothetical protein KHM83_09715 [Fusibacter paucivorans]|uniref:Uncharacterized protein n=1 Tax=Fusibacter paucivorans TaxID=76009 RepID=A0ABS5PP67_9FIRM|nr:DUF5702 domain-containing protein [Fusibacter paucivorans]MBS7526955.1 hypothetical protein [Fusibacter paucivorans]
MLNRVSRGSVSIFAVIVVPVFLFGIFTIYQLLEERKLENNAIITGVEVSEVRLAKYSSALYDDYRILAYEKGDQMNDLFNQLIERNGYGDRIRYDVAYETLSDAEYFKSAVVMAGTAEGVSEVIDLASSWADEKMAKEGVYQKFESVKKVNEKFLDTFENHHVAEKLSDLRDCVGMTSAAITGRLNDLSEAKHALTQVIDEARPTFEDQDAYDQDVAASITLANEMQVFIERGTRKASTMRIVENALEGANNELRSHKARRRRLRERILTAPISQISEINERIRDVNDEIDDDEEAIERLEEQLETIQEEFSAQAESFSDTYASESSSLWDQLKSVKETFSTFYDNTVSVIAGGENDAIRLKREAFEQISIEIHEKMIINEFCLGVLKSKDPGTVRNFDFTNKKADRDGTYEGEVEYLIGHTSNDQFNQTIVDGKILATRTLSNALTLLTDATARQQVISVTVAIPMPFQVLAQGALVTAWSIGESIYDITALHNGKGLPLVKTYADFELSSTNLMATVATDIAAMTSAQTTNGHAGTSDILDTDLYYQDYLRLLLLAQPVGETMAYLQTILETNIGSPLTDYAVGHQVDIVLDDQVIMTTERHYE